MNWQHPRRPNAEPPPNPEEILTGACGTCHAAVECLRMNARKAQGNHWPHNQPSAECMFCGAAVYLSPTGRVREREKAVPKPAKPLPTEAPVMERMLDAMRRESDLELNDTDRAELERLEIEAEKAMGDGRFIQED